MTTRRMCFVLGLLPIASLPACDEEDSSPASEEEVNADRLDEARQASEKYLAGPEVAEQDGFVASGPCESSDEGTMGIHVVNPDRLASPPDIANPPILVYLPEDDELRLVAIEYLQPIIQDGEAYACAARIPSSTTA